MYIYRTKIWFYGVLPTEIQILVRELIQDLFYIMGRDRWSGVTLSWLNIIIIGP